MHLKKLEIQGFKSFPEYTLIEFNKGMTAIVGPNGSGKSNVTDAIRWVLGEQSVRTLRGGKMEDVIFNGTQSRRAMNYAEVSMTIDNSDGLLGIDYSEVQITRRLYRSGESEYQINRINCRLKDIVTLFMDTGIGKDGYSIVGQGRVDEILSSRSEDRRKVLEEASGIVKYKVRKDEAERKLLSTEQNLIRISDILSELNEQVAPLMDQASKAKQYHRIYEEWKALDIGLSLYLIDRNQAFLSASIEETNAQNDEIQRQEDAILEMRSQNRILSETSSRLEDMLEESRVQAKTISNDIHEIQSSIAVIADRRSQLSNRIDTGESEEGLAKSEIDRLESEHSRQNIKTQALQVQLDRYSADLSVQEDEMSQLLASIDQSQNRLANLRKRMEDIQESLFEDKELAQKHISEILLLDSRMKTLSQERLLGINELDSLNVQIEDAEKAFKDIAIQSAKTATALSEKRENIDLLRKESSSLVSACEQKKRELDNVAYRIRTLEEIEKSREGYQEPVRRLLSAAESDANLKRAVMGVLGELVRVPSKYEIAIEIALGQAVHNIITQSSKDASFLIDYLKTNHLGRVTFLPVDVIKPRDLEQGYMQASQNADGFLGIASELLEFPSYLRGIVHNLLGGIVIMDTLSNALLLASKTSNSFRLVTLEGDVVNTGGSMTGGSIRRQGSGLLGRSRELENLRQSAVDLEKLISELVSECGCMDIRIIDAARQEAILDEELHKYSMDQVRADAYLGNLRSENNKLRTRLSIVERETQEISSQRMHVVENQEDCQSTVTSSEKELLSLRQILSQTDVQNKAIQEHLDDLRKEIGNLRISVGSIEESLRGSVELSDRIQREKTGYSDGLLKRQNERENARQEVMFLVKEENEKSHIRDALETKEAEVSAKIKTLQLEKEELEHELSGYIDRLSAAASRLAYMQGEQARMQAKAERFETDVDEYKNRMWEDHELTYDNAQTYRLEIDNPQPAQRRILELKNEMKELGPVNLGAIDEYDRVSERFTFMQKQKIDIEDAKANLTGIIADLVAEMRLQFLNRFDQINENFKLVFSDLFNGGTAEILLEDQSDVLSCGIDIRAQPPGKKLQSLSLLSGGERCLTAIALLFAILQLRPSPFCVLDEVEAALDDINVNRFTDFVRRYTTKSQFILVTHRKGTMEACDRMYGITMQERGISKILSMRLGDS